MDRKWKELENFNNTWNHFYIHEQKSLHEAIKKDVLDMEVKYDVWMKFPTKNVLLARKLTESKWALNCKKNKVF